MAQAFKYDLLSGSLQKTVNNLSYLVAGPNITITTASNGQVTINTLGTGFGADANVSFVVVSTTSSLSNERALTAGTGISLTDAGAGSTITTAINNSVVATTSGSTFTGVVKFNAGASGSITSLTDGRSFIAAGSGVTITSASNGQITITNDNANVTDDAAQYVVISTTSSLPNERALTAGTGITLTDGGAGSTITTAINNSVVATTSGSTFTGVVNLNAGASGSITKLTDGRDYIAAGTGITIVSQSNGQIILSAGGGSSDTAAQYVVLTNTTALSSERALTAGTGITLTDGGAGSTITTAVNNSVVSVLSGTIFTGVVNLNAGASGSITKLSNGNDFIVGSTGITVTNESNGQIIISQGGPSDIVGTTSDSWTVNTDSTAAVAENPSYILIGGDAVAAPNNDTVKATFLQNSSTEIVEFYLERERNGGGYTNIPAVFQIGKHGNTTIGGVNLLTNKFFIGGGKHGTLGSDALTIGYYALAAGSSSLSIGHNAAQSGSAGHNCTIIGNNSVIGTHYAETTIIGSNCIATSEKTTCIGHYITASGAHGAVAIGHFSYVGGSGSIAIGHYASSSFDHAICLGHTSSTTAANQMVIGSGDHSITSLFVGTGATATAGATVVVGATGGAGSNINASSINFAGGRPTGTGTGGAIDIRTPVTGAAATTQNGLATRYSIAGQSGSHLINLTNNISTAFRMKEGTQDYFKIDTNNGASQTPSIIIGLMSGTASSPHVSFIGNSFKEITHRTTASEETKLYTTGFTTTDNTVTPFWSYTMAAGECMHIETMVLGNNASDSAGFKRIATARRDTGQSVEIIGSSSVHTAQASALVATDVNITGSNNDVQITIKGISSTELNWVGWIRHQNQIK